ncbi:MAG: hypothetical protein KBA31_09600 [Alphaproteobacteria bacterium]|nr:hypothetical protein [Alphaproteobacteria bacterium]
MTGDTKDMRFPPQGHQVRSDAEAREIARWLGARVSDKRIHFDPAIPAKKVLAARQSCSVPESEKILALVDLTLFGSAAECIVIGWSAIYFRWPSAVPPKRIDFSKLVQSEVSSSWSVISIGGEHQIGAVEAASVFNLLKGLQEVLVKGIPAQSDREAAAPHRTTSLLFPFVLIGLVLFFARDLLSGAESPVFLMAALAAAIVFATFLFSKR